MKPSPVTSSSARSSTTEDRSESRESYYFPGCRKDANCNCEICLASINATLDLMPMSIQKSCFSSSKPKPFAERTPIPFKSSILSTPAAKSKASPIHESTAKSNVFKEEKFETKERSRRFTVRFSFWRIMVALSMIFAIDSAFSWLVCWGFRPKLSAEIVKTLGEESLARSDLNEKLGLLQTQLEGFVKEKVSDCGAVDANWKLKHGGLLTASYCTMYRSIAEEVKIWGWPLQNEGLLVSGFSDKSLTILSGRITEWPNGRVGFSIRKANSSWTLGRLKASVVQLDPNTWFLEYGQNAILENSRLSLAAGEIFKVWSFRVVEELKSLFLVIPGLVQQYSNHGEDSLVCPT